LASLHEAAKSAALRETRLAAKMRIVAYTVILT